MFHAAAYYGGIGINQTQPATLYYTNLVMGANLMEAARLAKVKKFVAIGTACSYPGYLEGHLKEDRPLERPLPCQRGQLRPDQEDDGRPGPGL